jgi:hypothetical protein
MTVVDPQKYPHLVCVAHAREWRENESRKGKEAKKKREEWGKKRVMHERCVPHSQGNKGGRK